MFFYIHIYIYNMVIWLQALSAGGGRDPGAAAAKSLLPTLAPVLSIGVDHTPGNRGPRVPTVLLLLLHPLLLHYHTRCTPGCRYYYTQGSSALRIVSTANPQPFAVDTKLVGGRSQAERPPTHSPLKSLLPALAPVPGIGVGHTPGDRDPRARRPSWGGAPPARTQEGVQGTGPLIRGSF